MKYIELKETYINPNFLPVQINNNEQAGHGHVLSVKIVVPCYCQANCKFCFNKQTINTQVHNWPNFIYNIDRSLHELFSNIKNRKITLDITGNEPTFNIENFKVLMRVLKQYKDWYRNNIDKIVLTTNGFHIYECIPYMKDVVDIVNISLHHFDYNERRNIFRTKYIPSNDDLKEIIHQMNNINISVTSVAVIYEKIDFVSFVNKFAEFSQNTGFKDCRVRINFTDNSEHIRNQFNIKFDNEIVYRQAGLSTKHININNYNVSIYLGVTDLVDYVIGVEMVIDDNGKLYLDYNKRYDIDQTAFNDFDNNIYVIKNEMC